MTIGTGGGDVKKLSRMNYKGWIEDVRCLVLGINGAFRTWVTVECQDIGNGLPILTIY